MPRITKEGRAEYMREYTKRPNAAAKLKTSGQRYYAANRAVKLAYARQWYNDHKEHVAKRSKVYRESEHGKAKVVATRQRHKDQRVFRRCHVKRHYGITLEQNDALFAKFGGLCWSCLKQSARFIDHCHKTGKIRGALCHGCNVGIGNFKDSPALLKRAIRYLEKDLQP